MREFIRLQLKLKWGLNRNNSKKSAILTAIAITFAIVVALAMVMALTFVLRSSIQVTAKRLSVLYLTLIMIGLTVFATGMQINRLYRPGDLKITARFPLSPFKLFVGYLILNYIDLWIYSAILLLPIMVVFGIAMQCVTVTYILGVLLGIIFLPMVPFGLSIFIAIPVMYLNSFLEKYGIIRLIIFVIVLIGAFLLYNYILTVLAQFFIHRNWEEGTLEIWESLLASLDSYYNPAYYLGNIIFFEKFWLGFGVVFGAGVALIAGGVALARVVCRDVRNKSLESGYGIDDRRSEIDGYGSVKAIFRYTLKEILRTKTYSYFYFGVAISTPVMVFFCNRLVHIVGAAQVGGDIGFGASMLVLAVFMAMISSFTGAIISVEGKTFYITKMTPVSYRKQLLIKGLLNVGVSVGALAISVIVIAALKFVGAAEIASIIATQILLVFGLVFNGINLNLANPNLKPKANGEVDEINITYMLMIGLVIAAILGACSIIFPRMESLGNIPTYLICIAIAFVYAAINLIVYWFTVNKKYKNIEP